MVNRQKDGPKGQLNRAQGIALGCRANKKIVREKTFFRRMLLFRTKRRKSQCLPENNELPLRPQEIFFPDYQTTADGFYDIFLPPGRCPGLKFTGLSGRKNDTSQTRNTQPETR
jgi:hypothetical protein